MVWRPAWGIFVRRHPALLAWLARAVGLLAVVLAIGHLVPVVTRVVTGERPYDLHAVWLLWIGAILLLSGGANLGVSGGLRRSERWAWRVSGGASLLCAALTASLAPVFGNPLNLLLLGTHSAYLVAWALQRPGHGAQAGTIGP
jgi:hypothetical protein